MNTPTTTEQLIEEAVRRYDYFYSHGEASIENGGLSIDNVKKFLLQELSTIATKSAEINNWKPFSSAPKDREILVMFPDQMNVVQLYQYNHIYNYWVSKGRPNLGLSSQNCLWIDIPSQKEK